MLICWRLDRLGRSLKHLVTLLDELQLLGIAFVSLAEGIDATTSTGKLQMHILAAIAEFERARIAERVTAGFLNKPRRLSPLPRSDSLAKRPPRWDLSFLINHLFIETPVGTRRYNPALPS